MNYTFEKSLEDSKKNSRNPYDRMLFNTSDRNKIFDSLDVSYEDKEKWHKLTKDYYDKKLESRPSSYNTQNFLIFLKRIITDKPRNFIAKIAARLRETYRKWLIKANKEKDSGKLKWYKKILRIVLKGIDFLLRKLEGLRINYTSRLKSDYTKKNFYDADKEKELVEKMRKDFGTTTKYPSVTEDDLKNDKSTVVEYEMNPDTGEYDVRKTTDKKTKDRKDKDANKFNFDYNDLNMNFDEIFSKIFGKYA